MKAFINPLDPENRDIKKAIRQWVIQRFALNDSAHIEIVEHNCTEASCIYAETVISVTDMPNTEGGAFYKITKPLTYIRKTDIALMQPAPTKPKPHRH